MVKTNRTIRSGSRTEVLKVCASRLVKLCAKPLVKTYNVRNVFHNLHTDSRAEKLSLGLLCGFNSDNPSSLSALVCKKTEVGNVTNDRAHDIKDTGVTVTSCAENGVCINNRGRLCPRKNVTLLGLVAYLIKVASTGESVVINKTELVKLLFIEVLLCVHKLLENEVLKEVCRNVSVKRTGVNRELLTGNYACVKKLLHKVINRSHNLKTKGCYKVVILGCNRYKLFSAEGLAVHNHGLHNLGHSFALRAVKNLLLQFCKLHSFFSFFVLRLNSPHTLLKLRLESINVGIYALTPLARFVASGTNLSRKRHCFVNNGLHFSGFCR